MILGHFWSKKANFDPFQPFSAVFGHFRDIFAKSPCNGSNDPNEKIIRDNHQRDPDKSTSKIMGGGHLPQNKYTRVVVQRSSSKQMDAVLLRRNSSAVVNVKKSLGFSDSGSKNLISRNSSSSSLK